MTKKIIYHIKLLLLLLIDLLFRVRKFCKFIWSGKHEFERICEANTDIYTKTFQIDNWLERTNSRQICDFLELHFSTEAQSCGGQRRTTKLRGNINKIVNEFQQTNDFIGIDKSQAESRYIKSRKSKRVKSSSKKSKNRSIHFEDGDENLSDSLKITTAHFIVIILKAKGITLPSSEIMRTLEDCLYRILCYRASSLLMELLATTKYDAEITSHTDKLLSLWNKLVAADEESEKSDKAFPPELAIKVESPIDIVSNRWSHIGFQGEDPGTDFRGMGILGLLQLEYLARKPKFLARDLLKRSLNEEHSYPLAIVGINVTYNLYNLFKDGSMKHLYYDTGDNLFRKKELDLNLLETLNDVYIELFLRFDCFWHQSKPENIFAFKELMEKFVIIVKMDLCNRNFNFKFIY